MREARRVMSDHPREIGYQTFATDRLEPMESAQLLAALDCVPPAWIRNTPRARSVDSAAD